jgi:hypothetical protein
LRVGSRSDHSGETDSIAQADRVRDTVRRADQRATQFVKDEADKLDRARHDVAKDFTEKVDNVDKAVEKKATEAKSVLSSWFGGKK